MRRYPEYKESSVEWIGEIPKHWNLAMLKYAARLVYGDTLTSENRKNGIVPVYGSNGIIDTHSAANTLSPVIIVGRKGSLGKIQYSDVPCFVIDTAYYIDRRASHVNLRWLHYVLQTLKLERFRNSVLPGLNRESAEGQYVPLITIDEQTQIAKFLDHKTKQIDELIRIKERRIELLQEQRTALINQAVTKGLDPNVEMKPSGVEWIGEIPAHWTITRLKYISNIPVTYGLNIESDRYTTEGIRLIRITDIGESGDLRRKGVYLPEDCVPQEQMLNSYDLLLSRSGATVGKSYLHLKTGKYTSAGYLVRFNFDDYWTSKFIYYITLSHFYRNWLEQQIIISTIQNVNGEKYSNFQLPIPSYQEQTQIVNFLDRKTKQIDELIATELRKIELLKEYRQSLISEAVTGKIDVRNGA